MKAFAAIVLKSLVLALVLQPTAALARPLAPKLVPAEADGVIHIDVDALRGGTLWTSLLSAKVAEAVVEAKKDPKLAKIDIDAMLRELRGLTVWVGDWNDEKGAVVIDTAGPKRVVALVEGVPGHKTTQRGGYTIHSIPHDGEVAYMGVRGDQLVFGSDPGKVEQTLKTIDGKAPSLAGSPKLGPVGNGIFVMLSFSDRILKDITKGGQAATLKGADLRSLRLSLGERSGQLVLEGEAKLGSEEAARKVVDMARGGLALAGLALEDKNATKLLEAVKLGSSGPSVTIDFQYSVAELVRLSKQP